MKELSDIVKELNLDLDSFLKSKGIHPSEKLREEIVKGIDEHDREV